MKRSIYGLFALLLVALVACEDDPVEYDRSTVETVRPYTTQISDSLVSGTWDLAGSPYYVSTSVAVAAGQTLTIQPGVEVHMDRNTSFFVEGTLNAVGEAGNNIRFIGHIYEEDYGLWNSIVFLPGSDASRLEYCMVAYGAKFDNSDPYRNAAIVIDDCNPTIAHNLIYLNQYNGITMMHGAMPRVHSNIVYENDGSGIVYDTTHVGTTNMLDWTDSLVVHNNVSLNSSLAFRYPVEFGQLQWGLTVYDSVFAGDTLNTIDTLVVVDSRFAIGENIYQNENRDQVDLFGNCLDDANFDQINADIQEFNSCSPCIEAGYNYAGGNRSDVGPVLYQADAQELRKAFKEHTLSGTWKVTCDAFSDEPVVIQPGTHIEFSGFYGLEFNSDLEMEGVTMSLGPEAEWTVPEGTALSNWRSVLIKPKTDDLALDAVLQQIDVSISDCQFSEGSESGFFGQDWINNGGIVELRDRDAYFIEGDSHLYTFWAAINATVENCQFDNSIYYAVAAHGDFAHVDVDNCTFNNTGLSAFYLHNNAGGSIINSRISGSRANGVFVYNTNRPVTVSNNLVMSADVYGVKVQAAGDVAVTQNTIINNGYGGIKIESQSTPVIMNNIISGNDFSGHELATGIVGNQIGAVNDTNNPMIDENWFYDNGGSEESFPQNWQVGGCNQQGSDPQLSGDNYMPATGSFDCGGQSISVGWNPGGN